MLRPRISMSSYLRAFSVFASTPRASKRLPARLSGSARKKFSLTVFTLQSWKKFTGQRKVPASYLPAEAFMSYINRIDDMLDRLSHPSVVNERIVYKKDPVARKNISNFVEGVRKSGLSVAQQRELYSMAGEFRRLAWKELSSFEEKRDATLSTILRMKESTSGGMGRILVGMLNVGGKIPRIQRKRIENAFSNAFMATQIPDDIFDLREDYSNKVPNLAIAALQNHPTEYEWAIRQPKMTIPLFKRNCPQSYHELYALFSNYLSRLPVQNTGERAFQAIPALFWKVARLTKR